MTLQRMTLISSGKSYTGFIEKRNDGGIYFNYWDPEVDNGKWQPAGKWRVSYVFNFKPESK